MEQALALSRKAAEVFKERGVPNARLDAELLLANVLQIDRLKLYLQHDRPVTPPEVERFREHVRRRIKREPVQYIIGEVTFRELVLAVDPRALIPRPETELLVGEVLKYATSTGRAADLSVLDIGTGTGAIALSIAREAGCRVVATDVSADALALAGENATRTGLREAVELRLGASWDAVREGERFDVVVSNPPYIAESERGSLEPEVAMYEPEPALFAQDGGKAVLWELIEGAHARLEPGGILALEVGHDQAADVAHRIEETGKYGSARIMRDYAGRDRMVIAHTN